MRKSFDIALGISKLSALAFQTQPRGRVVFIPGHVFHDCLLFKRWSIIQQSPNHGENLVFPDRKNTLALMTATK